MPKFWFSLRQAAADVSSEAARGVEQLQRRLLSQFHVAFALMGIIPLLICLYLITVKFFSLSILEGMNGVYFLIAVVFALLGLLVGQMIIRGVVERLVHLNRSLRNMYDQQVSFVNNVSHEFRAPLTIIKGALDNLSDGLHGALTQDQSEPISMSQREVSRMKRLVDDLLDIARMEAGKISLVLEDTALQECVRETAKSFELLAKHRGLALRLDLPEGPVRVRADRDRLTQVLVNLIGNAVKFTPQGEIRVRLSTNADSALIEVSDTGRGIPPEHLDRLFQKFERVGAAEEEGSGLGLAIAKAIVELHHGRIWVESAPGQGSRFSVTIPLQQER